MAMNEAPVLFVSWTLLSKIVILFASSFPAIIHGRIIKQKLSVHPATTTNCANITKATICCEEESLPFYDNGDTNGGCGILRLDGNHSWSLRSGDGVYGNISVTVSIDTGNDI